MSACLSARQVGKRVQDGRGRRCLLTGVDLEVAAGELVALVGPSGAGKTSLLHILGALDDDYQGQISLVGTALASLDDADRARLRARHCGYVFQEHNLLAHLSARDNVLLAAGLRGVAPEPARADALLGELDLAPPLWQRRPAALSGGEQQRVAFARALYARPQLLFCDEPTSNLDPLSAGRVLVALSALRQTGTAVLVATHDASLAATASQVLHLSPEAA